MESMKTEFGENIKDFADELFEESINEIIHLNAIKFGKRADGRKMDELRPIFAAVNLLPRVHGSGLFYRGSTHILSVVTLGAPGDVQLIEGMEIKMKKRFMHHYNFPPFSSGETGRMGNPGRREIGHGALAEKALSWRLFRPAINFPTPFALFRNVFLRTARHRKVRFALQLWPLWPPECR